MTQPGPPPPPPSLIREALDFYAPHVRNESLVAFDNLFAEHPQAARDRFLDTINAMHGGPAAFRDTNGRPTWEMEVYGAAHTVASGAGAFSRENVQKEMEKRAKAGGYNLPPGGLENMVHRANQASRGQAPPFEACAGAYNHIAVARDLPPHVALPGGYNNPLVAAYQTQRNAQAQQANLGRAQQQMQGFQNTPDPRGPQLQKYQEKAGKKPNPLRAGLITAATTTTLAVLGGVIGSVGLIGMATVAPILLPAALGATYAAKKMFNSAKANGAQKQIAKDRAPIEQGLGAQVQQAGRGAQQAGEAAQKAREQLYKPIAPRGR